MKFSFITKLLFFLLASIPLAAQSNTPYFERLIPSAYGKSLPVIHCITQDHQGFIWITSPYGLARYDGNEFLIFQHEVDDPTSLIDNFLFSVFEDSRKKLWLTTDKGLELLDRKSGNFTHFQYDPSDSNSLPSNRLRSIAEDKNGHLWIGTLDAGICQFDPSANTFIRYKHDPTNANSPSSDSIWAIYCDQKGRIWIGTHEGRLDCLDKSNGQWIHYNLLPNDQYFNGDPNVWDICEGRDGKIWVGTSNLGLIGLDPDTGAINRVHLRENKRKRQLDYQILSLHQDRQGIIWIGTLKSGIFKYNPLNNRLKRYVVNTKRPGSLCDNSVITIFEDRYGLLWFGTGRGISLFNKNRFRFPLVHYDAQIPGKLTDNNILAIFEDKGGVVWISTALGGLNIWDRKNNQWNRSPFPPKVRESFRINPVQAICEDRLGNLWFGSSQGLHVYEPGKKTITHIGNTDDNMYVPPAFGIRKMAAGNNGCLWIGTKKGELFKWNIKNGDAHFFPNSQQKINKSMYIINVIYVDHTGGVWIGTKWQGVDYFDPENRNWIHYTNKAGNLDSFPSSTVYSIGEDKAGKIWVGTEAGPCYLDPKTKIWYRLSAKLKLPDHSAYGLLFDKSNGLWMSTKTGLHQINLLSFKYRIFGPEDGLQNRIFNPGVCFMSRNGEMFFGGISGFNHFYPDKLHLNLQPPPLAIAFIRRANQKKSIWFQEGMKPLAMTKKDLPLTIKITALSFAFPKKNHYKVRVLGDKPNEFYLGSRNIFYITELNPGKNRFLIQGSNHDLIWNETGFELVLQMELPFFRPWYLIGMVLILAAFFFIRYRHRKAKEKSIVYIPKDISALSKRFQLTKREQEIIGMILDGKSNKDIENELYISLKTVKSHIYNIYRKLKVKNRLQLMNIIQNHSNKNQTAKK